MRQKKIFYTIFVVVVLLLTTMASKMLQGSFDARYQKPMNTSSETIAAKDTAPPVLKLKMNRLTVYEGDEIAYTDFVAEAYDNADGDLTSKVVYTEIDVSHEGEQTILYTLTDSSGNTTTAEIQVKVKKKVSFLEES